jgi:hypothetical protein
MRFHIENAKASTAAEGFVPNPRPKLLDQVSKVMRFKHYSIRTETTYRERINRIAISIPGRLPDTFGLTRAVDKHAHCRRAGHYDAGSRLAAGAAWTREARHSQRGRTIASNSAPSRKKQSL